MVGGPSKGPVPEWPCLQQPIARAVGAADISPALQRGVSDTNICPGVPLGTALMLRVLPMFF